MKLYLIEQGYNNDYDTYDSAVVAAESEKEARFTHPGEDPDWDGEDLVWGGWCHVEYVRATYIGEAAEGTNAGVILASFNAG